MRLTLSLSEAPRREPVTLEDARQFLKLDHHEDDPLLKGLITGARAVIENYTNRALLHQTWRALYEDDEPMSRPRSLASSASPTLRFHLPRAPFYALKEAPKILSLQGERPLKEYRLIKACSCGVILLTRPLLWGESLSIDFVAGYGEAPDAAPAPFHHALLMMVAEMYENRWSPSAHPQRPLLSPALREVLAPLRIMTWM